MKKNCLILMLVILITVACGAAFAADGKVEVSFKYDRLSGNATNQFAIWVEDAEGKYVDTVFATYFTANGGWQTRPNALLRWVKHAEVAKMSQADVDAVAGATPAAGALKYEWDLRDKSGKRVPDGDYMILLEATLRNEQSVVYRALVSVGGGSATIRPVPKYAGEDETDRKLVSDVVVRYLGK